MNKKVLLPTLFLALAISCLSFTYFKNQMVLKKDSQKTVKRHFYSQFQITPPSFIVTLLKEGQVQFVQVSLKFYLENQKSLDEFKLFEDSIKEFVILNLSSLSFKSHFNSFSQSFISRKIQNDINQFLFSGKVEDVVIESLEVLEG